MYHHLFKPELFWRLAETSWKKISVCPPDPPTPRQAALSDVTAVLSLKNQANAQAVHLQDISGPSDKKPASFPIMPRVRKGERGIPLSLQRDAAARTRCQPARQGCRQSSPRAGAASHSHRSAAAFLSGQQFTSNHLSYSPFYECLQGCTCVCMSIWQRAFFFFNGNTCIQTCLSLATP